jgi:hypothetical protein
MSYTTINKSGDYFNTKLYTGNGSTQSITGVGFQPDFTWIKSRTSTHNNQTFDVLKGVQKSVVVNESAAEITMTNGLTAFGTDGFTIGSDDQVNNNSQNFCSWNWKANGAGSSNTDGSINSTVSANTTAGFSIVKWTGNSTSGATVGHGLGVVPKMIIVKTTARAGNWITYHHTLGATKYLELNNTGALGTSTAAWNDTAPTSSVFSLGSWSNTNDNGYGMIAYCFAEKKGYSKFGSYVGNNNNDGSFIYTGFKPAFVMIKSSSDSSTWHLADNKRIGYNPLNYRAQPNNDNAEYTGVEIYSDFLSNGFKLRNQDTDTNGSRTYIYMAFAEAPLVGSNNVPCTAR